MSNRPGLLLLEDMLDSMQRIESYTAGMSKEEFFSDQKTADAVVRNLEIIGEASNRLPKELKQKYPDIEWANIVGLRHRIVHEYFGVDLHIIWQILNQDLIEFKSRIRAILLSPHA